MLDVAIKAIKKAGEILKQNYRHNLVGYTKNNGDFYSKADLEVEKAIVKIITKTFPTHSIFTEERGLIDKKSDYLWQIDPLDGSSNYLHKIPFFCSMIALLYKKRPILGVVYDPLHDELFFAEENKGSWCNGKKLKGSKNTILEKAFISVFRNSDPKHRNRYGLVINKLTDKVRRIRTNGSALELCYTAAGRYDASICIGYNLYDWLPGYFIAKEAGLSASDFKGQKLHFQQTDLIIGNNQLNKLLIALIKDIN